MTKNPSKDHHLWQHVTQGIKPLKKDRYTPPVSVRLDKHTLREGVVNRGIQTQERQFKTQIPDEVNYTKRVVRQKKTVHVEGRLDLHGLTQEQARYHVHRFLTMQRMAGHQWVLIITGKGITSERGLSLTGILREKLPSWLDASSDVGGYSVAAPEHGGSGALYVRLKKGHS